MLTIKNEVIIGKTFQPTNLGTGDWTCIGYSHPYYVVGIRWDKTSNRTLVKTFKFDDIHFLGELKV